jgi:hypothetical protein
MSARLATRMSLRYLTAALVAGLALSLAPTAPVRADEDPGVRAPRVRTYAPRVRTYAPRVRTVVRTRVVYVPQPVYTGCGSCASAPAPVVYRPAYYAPRYYAPQYYAGYYGTGCGGCAQPVAAPYYWAVRYARYRAYGYY